MNATEGAPSRIGRGRVLLSFVPLLAVMLTTAAVVIDAVVGRGLAFSVGPIGALIWSGLALFAVGVVAAVNHKWRKLSSSALGLHRGSASWKSLVGGFALAVGAVLLVVAVPFAWGAWEIGSSHPPAPSPLTLAFALLAFLASAVFQQVFTLSGLVALLRAGFSDAVAVGLPSVLFGLIHLSLPGATVFSTANTVLLCVGFALLFIGDASEPPTLGLSIGFHTGWNFAIPCLFGLPLSGSASPWAITALRSQATLWTGGDYGPEGGLGATIVLGALCAWLLGSSRARRARTRAS